MMSNNNQQNGGMLYLTDAVKIISQAARGKGMQWYGDRETTQEKITPYYINAYNKEKAIYYCNAQKNAALCKMRLEDAEEQIIIKESIDLLQKQDNMLYFINKNKNQLYTYALDGKEVEKVLDDKMRCFLVMDESILYATDKALFCCDLEGREKEKIVAGNMIRLVCNDEYIVFIDKDKAYSVGYMNLANNETSYIEGSIATSINIYKDNIFYNNGNNKNHIFRYGIDSEFDLKFIPQPAEYLHIFDETLCYLNQDSKVFMQVSVQGGKPMPLVGED